MANFALIGAAGFVAPRHMKAIAATGNKLVAAVDPHDSVGILDQHFPEARFFTEIERFDRHLEKLRRAGDEERTHYVSVCTPNYLHDAHVRLALRLGATAICEKPLVISPWNLDQLAELEEESDGGVRAILQLRHHPEVLKLQKRFELDRNRERASVVLTYVTRRGSWYHSSWKGAEERSGGLAMNVGVHFFDLLLLLFGGVVNSQLHLRTASRMSGVVELEWARVRWFLSVDERDLPEEARASGAHAARSLTFDGEEIDLSAGFGDLHTKAYQEVLDGRGATISDTKPSIELVHRIRTGEVTRKGSDAHPLLSAQSTSGHVKSRNQPTALG